MARDYIPSIDDHLTYIDKDTFLQRWDPRTKLISCVGAVFLISAIQTPSLLVGCFLTLLVLVLIMGLGPWELLKKTSLLLPFIVFMSLPILAGGGWPLDKDRVRLVLLLAFKGLSSLYLMFILFFTQPMWELLGAMSHLGLPDVLMSIVFLTWRYVFVLSTRLKKMHKALSSRLFQARLRRESLEVSGQVMAGMLIKSLDTSDTVYKAMLTRGFTGRIPVSRPRPIGGWDLVKSFLILGSLVLVLVYERW